MVENQNVRVIFTVPPTIPHWQEKLIVSCGVLVADKSVAVIVVNCLPTEGVYDEGRISFSRNIALYLMDRRKVDPDAFTLKSSYNSFEKHETIHIINEPSALLPESDLLVNLVPWLDDQKLSKKTGRLVWGIQIGDSVGDSSPLSTSQNILSGSSTTSLKIVETIPDQGGKKILYEAASSTISSSVRVNSNQLAWKAVECIPRLLVREISTLRPESSFMNPAQVNIFWECAVGGAGESSSLQKISFPLLAKWVFSRVVNKIKNKYIKKQWVLGIGEQSSRFDNPVNILTVLPPKDRFWADPHLVEHDSQLFVFFEELLYAAGKGHISCAKIDGKGLQGDVIPVLEREYHLSYPFILKKDGEMFMIPESAENGTIELYRCHNFPDKWEYQGNLMEGVAAYDTTIFFHNGYWWLFANMSPLEGVSSWDQLYLYYAKEFPTDNWKCHPANPIVDDVRFSRPAGRIFAEGGRLYRPSQDSAGGYGKGLNLQEIIEITPDSYTEISVWQWQPRHFLSHAHAVHSFSYLKGMVALDLQINRYPWSIRKNNMRIL